MSVTFDTIERLDQLLARSDASAAREADALLGKIGHSKALHDTLAVHRVLVALKNNDNIRALSEALRAVWLFPVRAEPKALVSHILDKLGAESLSLKYLSAAAKIALDDPVIQKLYLQKLYVLSPELASSHLGQLLPTLTKLNDVKQLLPVLELIDEYGTLGCAWRAKNQISGWVWRPGPLEYAWWYGNNWEIEPVVLHREQGYLFTFARTWPLLADGLVVRGTSSHRPISGTPITVTPDVQARTSQTAKRGARSGSCTRTPPVDVIIPVFADYDITRTCINSVLDAKVAQDYNLVVIDDATQDTDLAAYLSALASENKITLLRNPMNLGFTASVNSALALSETNDVVLLNADTIVCDGWLDRLQSAVATDDKIATVTPLSNNGQLVSFPVPTKTHPLPPVAEIQRLDALASVVNAGSIIDLPNGSGFCLFIRRACLREIGFLDAQTFGRGYGEETDFCWRAASKGWRNVCAANVYVGHHGSVSFGDEKEFLVASNMPKVAAKFPKYREMSANFLRDDPLAESRHKLEQAALKPSDNRTVLAVGPANWRDIDILRTHRFAAAERGDAMLWLSRDPLKSRPILLLRGEEPLGPAALRYQLPEDAKMLISDLVRLNVAEIQLHDVPTPALSGILKNCGLPITLYIHDTQTFSEVRERQLDIHDLGTDQVIARSQFAYDALRDKLPVGITFEGLPRFPQPILDDGNASSDIAVIAGSNQDGMFNQLLGLARHAAHNRVPLKFHVFGTTVDDLALSRTQKVVVLGDIASEDRMTLARSLGCKVALCLGSANDPLGDVVDLAAQICSRLLVVSGGARDERAALHPSAGLVSADIGLDDLLDRLWSFSQGEGTIREAHRPAEALVAE